MKDQEIESLKKGDKEKQKIISDLTIKLLQIEENINAVNKRCKKIEEKKNAYFQQSLHKTQDKSCVETPTWASTSSSSNTPQTYNIPTSNVFEPLPDEVPCLDEEINKSSNKLKTDDKENSQNGNMVDQQNVTPQHNVDCHHIKNNTAQPKTNEHFPENNNQKPINAETIIICDSNGRYLKPKELCPNSTTRYIRSATLSKAKQIVEASNFINPKNFIVHCGTNDMEYPERNTAASTVEVVDLMKNIQTAES